MKSNFDKTFKMLDNHYSNLFNKYGNSVKTSQQSSRATQKKRMEILTSNISFTKKDKILDFGCGTGFFLNFIKKKKNFRGYYYGCDISKKIIDFNKKGNKDPKVFFFCKNILKSNLNTSYDYIFINGTFNNKTRNNYSWMKEILSLLILKTKKKIIFNNLSKYVDYKDKNLFYADPLVIFDFCKKKLSKNVSIDHSYFIKKNVIPFEFTTTVSKKSK